VYEFWIPCDNRFDWTDVDQQSGRGSVLKNYEIRYDLHR
jgi:hypothetical protein